MDTKYKFRLIFYHAKPSFFRIEEASQVFELDKNLKIEVFPRDADDLISATKYHIDSFGFLSEAEAWSTGEKLRTHLRLFNCVFNLGLNIPMNDSHTGHISDEIKQKVKEQGATLLDTMTGLHVYPEKDHLEHVVSGQMKVYPEDPTYVLKAIKETWASSFEFTPDVSDAIQILNLSTTEASSKTRFLTAYLAMEQVIEKNMRSPEAIELIDSFIDKTKTSNLPSNELNSLIGSLGRLKEQSFSSAFVAFSKRITTPEKIYDMPVTKFVSECIAIRNKIAHKSELGSDINLDEFTNHLRQMVLMLLWTENNFPPISVYRPSDRIEMEKMEFRML